MCYLQKKLCSVATAILLIFFQQSNCWAAIVYASDIINGTISRIDENGAASTFATGLSGPSQILVTETGTVFISSLDDGTIRRFSASGDDLGVFAELSDVGGNRLGAGGMALDSAGNLYVGSSSFGIGTLGDIRKFSAEGTDLGVFAHLEYQGPDFF